MSSILLIDDDSHVRKMFESCLLQAGYSVTSASDGRAGMNILADRHFDLVITDILMPECDGLELLSFLRTRADRPRIIAMSGGACSLSRDYVLDMAKMIAADTVLQKPVNYETLLHSVQELLAGTISQTTI